MAGPTDAAVPPFALDADRYNQSTFFGRLSRISSIFNPMLLLQSDAAIQDAKDKIAAFKGGGRSLPDAELWDARTLLDARCHPDSGEKITTPFCFAAYAPMQPPIILGMLWPGATLARTVFWQWYNQSYNTAVSYENRNASGTLTDSKLAMAYGGAVGAACGTAIGMSKLCDAAVHKFPKQAGTLKMAVPFTSVVVAGTLSLVVVRQGELEHGVAVKDHLGDEHGQSHTAAKEGLGKCAFARLVWNIPVLLIPPHIMKYLEKTPMMQRNPRLNIPVLTTLTMFAMIIGIYPAQAIFPQQDSIAAAKLEPQFQGLTARDGTPINTFTYNKGL